MNNLQNCSARPNPGVHNVLRSAAKAALRVSGGLSCFLLSSCLLPLVLDANHPKPFVSSQPMSAACVEEVYRFVAVITAGGAERSAEHTRMIQQAFTTGESLTIVSQKTPDGSARAFEFYFSRDGDQMRLVVTSGAVALGPGSRWIDDVSLKNTWTGATVHTLRCPGPFVGHDLEPGESSGVNASVTTTGTD